MTNLLPVQNIREKIFMIRGFKVLLDRDLAELYGVETRVLNQAVRRNIKRFPEDFMFQLTLKEESLLRSQIVILEGKGKHSKYLSMAFTEQGVSMRKPGSDPGFIFSQYFQVVCCPQKTLN
jgi:hypothetical protein